MRFIRKALRWLSQPVGYEKTLIKNAVLDVVRNGPQPVGPPVDTDPPGIGKEQVDKMKLALAMNRMANAWPVVRERAERAGRDLALKKQKQAQSK